MTTSSTLTAVSSRILIPEGEHAVATYTLSTSAGGAVQLKAFIGGWDATVGVDTTGLKLSTDAGASWVPVAANGLFTLDAGATGFALRTRVAPDSLSELPESFVLVAHQTNPNPYLHNSWWSQTQVQIQDASLPPVSAARATLTAQYAVMSADEGQSAEATFNLSAALAQATGGDVAVVGWGAVPDSSFQYRLGTAGAWLDVPTGQDINPGLAAMAGSMPGVPPTQTCSSTWWGASRWAWTPWCDRSRPAQPAASARLRRGVAPGAPGGGTSSTPCWPRAS